jgi:parallel beta-helix repeat protein
LLILGQLVTNLPEDSSAMVVCGQTIMENTTLDEDVTCPPDTANAIIIGAPNITLDLGGHLLKGSTPSVGVITQNNDGIVIRNGIIDGFENGVFLINSSNATIENLTVGNKTITDPNHFIFGVHIDSSHDVVVRDTLFEFSSVPHKAGVEIYNSNVSVSNIEVRGGGAGVSFSFAQACDPVLGPSNGEVINSKFSQIYVAGIYVACSSDVRIAGNDISTATGVGVGIQGEAPFLGAVTGLKIEENNIHNDVIGIEFRGVSGSLISTNTVSENSGWGIAMRQSLGCLINEPGWECVYSTANTISDNLAIDNGTDLYHYEKSIGNIWERNVCTTKQGVDIPECILPPLRMISTTTNYFMDLSTAYAAAPDSCAIDIEAQSVELPDNVVFNRDIIVSLKGGFDSKFTFNGSYTTIVGLLTVSRGSVVVDGFIVK